LTKALGAIARTTPSARERAQTLFESRWLGFAGLYALHFGLLLALVTAANQQQVLLKEEALAAYVGPVFQSFRLQHHIYATNFYSYLIYQLGHHLFGGLFGVRLTKITIMALLPGSLYLYLRDRFKFGSLEAFVSAIAVVLLPGVLCLSWVATEMAEESALGFLALWFALNDRPWAMLASTCLAAISAGCYGSGLACLLVVMAIQASRLRVPSLRLPALASMILAGCMLLIPLVWWTNAQTLFIGGGGSPDSGGSPTRLAAAFKELFVQTASYYMFANGRPALATPLIGALALAGLVWTAVHYKQVAWQLFAVALASLALLAVAGNVPGVRRAVPLMICLALFAILLLHSLLQSERLAYRAIAVTLFALWLIPSAVQYEAIRSELLSSRILLPQDFEFTVENGGTMASTVEAFANRSRPLPPNLQGYEPDRTLCILFSLTEPTPIVSREEMIAACDRHGWSVPSNAPRFAWLRKRP
jgi:hypothetical protein